MYIIQISSIPTYRLDSAPNHAATICQGPTLSLSATHASKICYSSNHIPYAIIQIKLRDIQKYDHDGKMANQVPRIKDPPLYVKKNNASPRELVYLKCSGAPHSYLSILVLLVPYLLLVLHCPLDLRNILDTSNGSCTALPAVSNSSAR